MTQKGFSPIFIIVLVLVGGLLIGGAFYGGTIYKSSTKNVVETATESSVLTEVKEDSYKDWKTFSNKYISFKYPPEWYMHAEYDDPEVWASLFEEGVEPYHGGGESASNAVFDIYTYENETRTLQEIVYNQYPEATSLKVGDKTALKNEYGAIFVKPVDSVYIHLVPAKGTKDEYVEQILSSVKFLSIF